MSPTLKFATTAFLCSSLIAGAALPQASTPSKNFDLETVVTCGDAKFNGLSVTGVHTGAGSSAAVATSNHTLAEPFFLNATYLGFSVPGTPPTPYTFNLVPSTPYMNNAPALYNQIDIDAGYDTPGFSLDQNNIVQYSGNVDFKGFAACNVTGIAPYFGLGGEIQLLWKNSTSVADAPNCANVDLKAVFTS